MKMTSGDGDRGRLNLRGGDGAVSVDSEEPGGRYVRWGVWRMPDEVPGCGEGERGGVLCLVTVSSDGALVLGGDLVRSGWGSGAWVGR